MAKKRKAYVHVGMPGVGDVVEAALVRHRDALVELGVAVPAKTSDEAFRAAVEILRQHKTWGFKRSEVEGEWARLCRRAHKGRSTLAFSQSLLCAAQPEQVDLLLDALAGFEVHVIVTATAPHAWTVPGEPETDLGVVLDRWGAAVRKPERLHLVLVESGPDRPGDVQRAAWKAVGKVVGFGTASLRLDDVPVPAAARPDAVVRGVPPERVEVLDALIRSWIERIETAGYTVHGDLDAVLGALPTVDHGVGRENDLDRTLHDALREIERLSRRNESLEQRLESVDKKRRKLKRKLSEVA